jgi:TRAP-type C4-dicarboxylate transport system permease small subunit
MSIVKRFLEGYAWVLRKAMTLLLGLLVIPVTLQIVSRYTELIPRYIWTEEAARFFFIWMIMLGSTIAVREQTHFNVDVLPKPKTPQGKAVAVLIVDVSMLLMALIFVRYGWDFVMFGYTQTSELTGINMAFIFVGFLLAGLTWMAFIGERFMENIAILRGGNHGAR